MKPLFLSVLPQEETSAYLAVKFCIPRLPSNLRLGKDEVGEDILLSPHILSRAIEDAFPPLRYADGIYANRYDHSWVVTPSGHIIDVMPQGVLSGPFIVEFSDKNEPPFSHYRALVTTVRESEHYRRYGERFLQMSFRLAVIEVTRHLKKIARIHNARSKVKNRFALAAQVGALIAS